MTDAVKKPVEYVILIHGTFAAHEDDAKTDGVERWWQQGSNFATALEKGLNDGSPECIYKVAPAVAYQDDYRPWWARPFVAAQVPTRNARSGSCVFHWSGANSESARRQGGKRLFDYLLKVESTSEATASDTPRAYHLIAHSHGGIVAWEALCNATRRNVKLAKLKSWTTVGTPFLRFMPDLWACLVWPVVGLFLLVVILIRQLTWWTDFWGQMADLPRSPWLICGCYLLTYIGLATVSSLLARFIWSCYCFSLADKILLDRYQLEKWDFFSSILALAFAMIIFAGLGRLYWGFAPDIVREVVLTGRWAAWLPVCGALWLVAAVVTAAICGGRIIAFFRFVLLTNETAIKQQAWDYYRATYFGVATAVAHSDEAICVLRALRRPIRGPMLPRFESPRTQRYTDKRNRVRQPEREQMHQEWLPWLLQFMLLPVTLIWHWVVKPVYNEVVAGLIDDYVLSRIRRSGIGEDVLGLKFHQLSIHPFQQVHPPRVSSPIERSLQDRVAKHAGEFLASIRRLIGQPWKGGIGFQRFIERAMQGKDPTQRPSTLEAEVGVGAADVLIHTNYFSDDQVRGELARNVKNPVEQRDPLPNTEDSEAAEMALAVDENSKKPYLADMLWWCARLVAQFLIVSLPLTLLAGVSFLVAYPYSREYLSRWALSIATDQHLIRSTLAQIKTDATVPSIEQNGFIPRVLLAAELVSGSSGQVESVGSQLLREHRKLSHYFFSAGRLFLVCRDPSRAIRAYTASLKNSDSSDAKYLQSLIKDDLTSAGEYETALKDPEFRDFEGIVGDSTGDPAPTAPQDSTTHGEGSLRVTEPALLNESDASADSWNNVAELDRAVRFTSGHGFKERTLLAGSMIKAASAIDFKQLPDDAARLSMLAVLQGRLTGDARLPSQWLKNALERVDAQAPDLTSRDYSRAFVAAAYADLGRAHEMQQAFALVQDDRDRLMVARHVLSWCLQKEKGPVRGLGELNRFQDVRR